MPDPIETIIPARHRRLGRHDIRRLLPARQRRMVGPVIYFDHIGPEALPIGAGVDVPPHPHINLATVTYLFEGSLTHRDSLGSVEVIRPGDINWMHAGRGIVHSERTDDAARAADSTIHGIQLWVALPQAEEETAPAFDHYPEASLPAFERDGAHGRLLVGHAYGLESPVRTRSVTLYVDLRMEAGATLELPSTCAELCAYVVEGDVSAGEHRLNRTEIAVFKTGIGAAMTATQPSRVLLLGGDPLDGDRHIWWNFVSSSPDRIEQARRDWIEERFPIVPGDEKERIPLPR